MATKAQAEFFDKLLNEREFGDKDIAKLSEQFSTLTDKAASDWIERALSLPKRDGSVGKDSPPPF